MENLKKLFEPIKIGSMEVKNRFVMAPMVTNYAAADGSVTERFKAYHEARAKGGVGLIVVEATYVHKRGKGFSNELGINSDFLIEKLKELTDTVHKYGAKIAVQLYHSGRQSYSAVTGGPLLAPSSITCPVCGETPLEMTKQDIREALTAFREGARRARAAGFDAVEVHGAHGYLIDQFLSPYSNRRTDEYGGSFENRTRFPLEVLAEVKAAVGDDFPVIYRLSSEEFVPGGLTIGDTTNFSVTLVEHGVDAIHVSGGVYESAAMIIQPAAVPQGLYISNAAAIKEAIGSKIPVMVVGRIKDPVMAAEIIEKGHADMIALGRSLLADPEFPEKVRAGTPENISPCIGCNQACIDRLFQDQDIACLGNPFTGREWQYNPEEKAGSSKRVLVIGGGPGGLEASRIAALRGHEVFLYEKDEKLGGLMSIASIPPHREEIRELVDFLISQVEKLGVNIRLGRAVDEVVINAVKPDTIVMATGSKPLVPSFIGEEKENVVTTGEAILTGAPFGRNVVVAGGGLVGCETAEFMAAKGARVTILEMLDDIGIGMGTLDKALLLNRLKELKVAMITGCKVKAFEGKNVIAEKAGREEVINEVDTIVLSLGYQPEVAILPLIKRMKIPYCMIGDCVEPRKITEAIYEGFINAYQL